MKPNLLILTNQFPSVGVKGEDWIYDELRITAQLYNKIYIFPEIYNTENNVLPINCEVINYKLKNEVHLNLLELINCLLINLYDYKAYPNKTNYFKSFRYNYALLKELHLKAKKISTYNECFEIPNITYAYWADNLATTASIIHQNYHKTIVVTRGHGFEIFEEQTKNRVIPFRRFQYKHLSQIFADSENGKKHLDSNQLNWNYKHKNNVAYVGTQDLGEAVFNQKEKFAISTCSYIRDIKRLHFMPEILKHIEFELDWHILGDGPDLEKIKQLNQTLPANIKVHYHGYLKNDEILQFYKKNSINLFCSLSYSEGLPVSMMEAQSFGMPIMSTDVGGCKEICHEGTGFLIEKDFNPLEVAKKINGFKDSPKNSAEFRKMCRKHWESTFKAENNYLSFAKKIISFCQN
ncbi:MAG: glycosyltransferase [Bacteroidota bacterium]|nr:glycosyltransferase [Bacteroidota bacterium]